MLYFSSLPNSSYLSISSQKSPPRLTHSWIFGFVLLKFCPDYAWCIYCWTFNYQTTNQSVIQEEEKKIGYNTVTDWLFNDKLNSISAISMTKICLQGTHHASKWWHWVVKLLVRFWLPRDRDGALIGLENVVV
jgi:hypothetical protein